MTKPAAAEKPVHIPRRHIEHDLLLGALPHPILVLAEDERVVYANAAAKSPVRIRNNAFANCQVGVMFDTMPTNPATFEIANNLFFKMNAIAKYAGLEARPIGRAGAVWLWHDEGRRLFHSGCSKRRRCEPSG